MPSRSRPHKIDMWNGCYPSSWQGKIVTEAMSHPAKFSSRLIGKIYDHIISEGWAKAGDSVVDVFGGVALGALDAMRLGLNWHGIELEKKFFEIGNQNIDLWNTKMGHFSRWGTARLHLGDSRFLLNILNDAVEVAVSSPPYSETTITENRRFDSNAKELRYEGGDAYGETSGQLGAMPAQGFEVAISSPPFLQSEGGTNPHPSLGPRSAEITLRMAAGNKSAHAYGESEGQLSSMKDGGFDVAVSSPPYHGMEVEKNSKSIDRKKQYAMYKKSGGGQTFEAFCHTQDIHSQGYGNSEGQLSSMKDGGFEVAVSSPPFENQEGSMNAKKFKDPEKTAEELSNKLRDGTFKGGNYASKEAILRGLVKANESSYGDTEGNLGNDSGNDFWLASRAIVEQVYLSLVPGGHAVWVVKDYVKNKQVVPFCDQWRMLCEAVGFKTLHEHHATLIRNVKKQYNLQNELITTQSESKSFFRRVYEKKGGHRIDYETVLCMEKP